MDANTRALRVGELLAYFKSQRRDYEVSDHNPFDVMATRFDFVKDVTHLMLHVPHSISDDHSTPELVALLERSDWWSELQSPRTVTFTPAGFRFRVA
jgi:hypothetical protein